jgi:hypothetical protein
VTDLTLDSTIKFLNAGGIGPYSEFRWPRPTDGMPGEWVEVTGALELCRNGIHACTVAQGMCWIRSTAYLIELDGERLDGGNKLCARRGRLLVELSWSQRHAAAFTCDCAERVLPIYEVRCGSTAPRASIETTRAWLRGEATIEEVYAAAAAAGAAAGASAGDAAAHAAAYSATSAAVAVADAASTASAGAADAADATYAAYVAAYADARGGGGGAERAWQASRLLAYLRGEITP